MFKDQINHLERSLGDPTDPDSGISFNRVLADDAAEAFPEDAALQLRLLGYCRFYVPTQFGGRFSRVDELLYALRTLSRRDLTLAIGHAVTMLGAITIWVGGSPQQRAACAAIVLADKPMSFALTEENHGSDLLASECTLTEQTDGFELNGEKWLINNATRSAALCVYVQHASFKGTRGSTIVFLVKDELASTTWESSPKIPTVGIRGADISGIRFAKALLSQNQVVGRVGQGLELVWRGLQLTRTLCSGLSLGAADTGLRLTALHAAKAPVSTQTRTQQVLAQMCETMLSAESVALCATRLAHVAPQELSLVSAIAKYFVPTKVESIFRSAQRCFGAEATHTSGTHAIFEKFARDQRLVSLFEGSTVVCLQMIAVQLKGIAKRAQSPLQANYVDVHTLFNVQSPLPTLELDRLTVSVAGNNTVCNFALFDLPRRLQQSQNSEGMTEMITVLDKCAARLSELFYRINDRANDKLMQDPFWFDSARIYCDLFSVSALASFWYCNRTESMGLSHPLFEDLTLLSTALWRCIDRDSTVPLDAACHYARWLHARMQRQEAISLLPLEAPFDATEVAPLESRVE